MKEVALKFFRRCRDVVAYRITGDVKYLHRMWSTWVAGGGLVAVPAAWLAVPQDLRAALPDWSLTAGGIILFLLFLLARVVPQPKIDAARNGVVVPPPPAPVADTAHPYGDVR